MKKTKTRFAPSPTGYLHVGGLRTALYAYLFAKQTEGIFLLRIEDTDRNRFVEGAAENLMETLEFFGLKWDEGPYYQSERTDIYKKYAKQLLETGHAYHCFCSSERLQKMREDQQKNKQSPKYDKTCLALSKTDVEEKLNQGKTYVIRQNIPQEVLEFHDEVRGNLSFHGKDVDDQVLVKSDGFPTYHLANVVDDHEMEITHVIRGEEWLPSTPKHIWLYKAFGWEAPKFAHLSLLLNPDKTKLSKRQGDVAAEDFIKKGYLKEAMINFIAFLGWNPGTEEEIFSLEELVNRFSFDRVQKAGAVFSLEKLDWLNGQYLREMSAQELALLILPDLLKKDWLKSTLYKDITKEEIEEGTSDNANNFLKYTECIQTRMKTLTNGPEMLKPFLLEEFDYDFDLFSHKKMKIDKAMAVMALENSMPTLEALEDYSNEESIKEALVKVIAKLGVKNGQVLWPLRVALSNEQYSPGVFELIMVLGKEITLKRCSMALDKLSKS
jgi:glutamyl-tRNA synthetase